MFLILKKHPCCWALADDRCYGSIKDAELMAKIKGGNCKIITKGTYEMTDLHTGELVKNPLPRGGSLQDWFNRGGPN